MYLNEGWAKSETNRDKNFKLIESLGGVDAIKRKLEGDLLYGERLYLEYVLKAYNLICEEYSSDEVVIKVKTLEEAQWWVSKISGEPKVNDSLQSALDSYNQILSGEVKCQIKI